jgi:hypothetical protein
MISRQKSRPGRFSIAACSLLSCLAFVLPVFAPLKCWAAFALIDNFNQYAAGTAISGQGAWTAGAGNNPVAAGVALDPLDPKNKVLAIGAGGFTSGRLGHRETINTDPAVQMNNGTTDTLFFRIAWNPTDVDLSIGMTDVANPISDTIFNSFTQFQSQFSVSFTPGFDHLAAVDGNGSHTLTTDVSALTWYNMWMVVNNTTDTTQYYIQGGQFATQTLLMSQGKDSFTFRNGATTNDLITLFIATGRNTSNSPPNPTENIGPVYIDDIYIDQSGKNLANPVPEPDGLLLAIICATTMPLLVRFLKAKRVAPAT